MEFLVAGYPVVGGRSGSDARNFDTCCLKAWNSTIVLNSAGRRFQSFGPITANDLSNAVCFDLCDPFTRLGNSALVPNRPPVLNLIPRLLGATPCRIFHI